MNIQILETSEAIVKNERMTFETPAAGGVRLRWEDLPQSVRSAIEAHFNCSVVSARSQFGGFSPGPAARLDLSDGRSIFAKAVSQHQNPDSPRIHRMEARVSRMLPASTPAPKLLWAFDDGEWVALVFENVEGHQPKIPWISEELDRVLGAIDELGKIFTPSPIDAPKIHENFKFDGWSRLSDAKSRGLDDLKGMDDWAKRNLDRLVELEASWEEAASGKTLLHGDIRADNILLTGDRVFFVDWPWASVGARWLDLLFFLPSVAMQGGPKPWKIFDKHPTSRDAPAVAVTRAVGATAGIFLYLARQPPPLGLPTLRRFQLAQGIEALEWLRTRTGWT